MSDGILSARSIHALVANGSIQLSDMDLGETQVQPANPAMIEALGTASTLSPCMRSIWRMEPS